MKIAVFYYTQSGQALSVARHLFGRMDGISVVYKQIVPLTVYPYPWNRMPSSMLSQRLGWEFPHRA